MNNTTIESFALVNPHPIFLNAGQKVSLIIGLAGLVIMALSLFGIDFPQPSLWLVISILAIVIGTIGFAYFQYAKSPVGIKNNGAWLSSLTAKGILGWSLGILLTLFYVLLYWYPQYLGFGADGNTSLVAFFDPLSQWIKGRPASQWFVYGTLYTLAILIFGVKFMWKYRHNRYQLLRTFSVMVSQTLLAFLIPEILEGLQADKPYFVKDLKQIWPLHYYFFEDWHLNNMLEGGSLGMFYLVWGILLILLISPVLTYFYGKRWYCSWVCGCGGLAETAGDPFRHLSDKKLDAWQIERIIIYGVLVLIVITTVLVVGTYFTGNAFNLSINQYLVFGLLVAITAYILYLQRTKYPFLNQRKSIVVAAAILIFVIGWFVYNSLGNGTSSIQFSSYELRRWYGFFIGAAFSGVVGVGFYPILGSRVWCRFGCPMAAILGIQQKYFSRFRITTNGNQCISCGNCSTYCEMGIDVRSYAQKGQNIVRASCVGCGICAAVCPGVYFDWKMGLLILNKGPIKYVIYM